VAFLRYREEVRGAEEIDLTVWRGDFLGIIGSSGAGKTTLLHAINV
jgi:ABC-type glutathione transport system ATPase component